MTDKETGAQAAEAASTPQVEVNIELTDEIKAEIKESVLKANPDKLEADLAAEIEEAEKARLAKEQEEQKDYIEAYKAVAAENEGKTEEEIAALVQEKLSVGKQGTEDLEESLGDSFFGEDTPASTQGAAKQGEGKTEYPQEIKEKLQELESIKSDPVFDAFIAARKAGEAVNFIDHLKKAGAFIDINSIPPHEIYRAQLVEMKALTPQLTDELIAEKVEEFKEKDIITQALEVKDAKLKLVQQQQEALKGLAGNFKVDSEAATKDREAAMRTLMEEASKYKDKEYLGLKMSDAHVTKAITAAKEGVLSFKKADGTTDHAAAARAAILLSNYREIMDTIYKKGQRDAMKKTAIKNGNSKSPIRISSGLPNHQALPSNMQYEKMKAEAKKLGMTLSQYMQRS